MASLVCLQLVDAFCENLLAFKHTPFHFHIWAVIRVAVSLLIFTVSPVQLAQNSHPPHPGYLLRHVSTGNPLSLTCADMPAYWQALVFGQHLAWDGQSQASGPSTHFDQLLGLLTGVANRSWHWLFHRSH